MRKNVNFADLLDMGQGALIVRQKNIIMVSGLTNVGGVEAQALGVDVLTVHQGSMKNKHLYVVKISKGSRYEN